MEEKKTKVREIKGTIDPKRSFKVVEEKKFLLSEKAFEKVYECVKSFSNEKFCGLLDGVYSVCI